MNHGIVGLPGQLERELAYYKRECNDLGARLLSLQEEQSRSFREARRSRTVAKLIREAYRLADAGATPKEIGLPMLGVIVENALCDAAAFLSEDKPGSGRFEVTEAVGVAQTAVKGVFTLKDPPDTFFTASHALVDLSSHEIMRILDVPYVFWAYDRASGQALILGNRSESNVNRAFQRGDQELIEGALSVYLDVLSRKQAEFDMRQAKARLEKASDAKGMFLTALSGHLAAPLGAILESSDRLRQVRRHEADPDAIAVCADRIHESGHHLVSLVDQLLDYGAIMRGSEPMTIERLPLAAMIEDAAGANEKLARAMQIAIKVQPVDPDLTLRGNRFRLRLLLSNLLSNSLCAAPANSTVTVGARQGLNGAVEIAVREMAPRVRPAGAARRDPARDAVGGGAGIQAGPAVTLPIARELCEAHGGWLVLEGAPDRGATVRAIFPDNGAVPGGD